MADVVWKVLEHIETICVLVGYTIKLVRFLRTK